MASHLACIGFRTEDPEELQRMTLALAERGEILPGPDGGRTVVWRDRSGAGLVFNVDASRSIRCITPTFWSGSRIRVVPKEVAEDGECGFCDRLLVDVVDRRGHVFYPLALQLEDLGTVRTKLAFNRPMTAALAAFAESLEVWPSAAAFEADQEGHESDSKLAAESLIPAGLFGVASGRPPGARALVTGRVLESEVKTNAATGEPFCHASVRTYGGVLDMVAAAEDLPGPLVPGNILQGMFWIVGRIVEGLRASARWTWVGRLFSGPRDS